jgi:hypothetical protein
MDYEIRFLIALAITVVTETTVIFVVIRALWKIAASNLSTARCLFSGIFASFATLPYLWFVLPALVKQYQVQVVTGETGVFVIEAIFYYYVLNLSIRRSAILSFAANAVSMIVGMLVFRPGI